MKPLFCPNCRKRINPPKFLAQANITGNINLKCGDLKCKGILKIKAKKDLHTDNQ